MTHGLPFTTRGQKIGLLGGSFDPPHAGHLHIARQAITRFKLDRVWWIVSPGNPLKPEGPADFDRRLAACRALAQDRRIVVSDLEARFGTRFTAQTLARLLPLKPEVDFVWLMGADNLVQFHHWEAWQSILAMVPVGVLARDGAVVAAGLSPAATAYRACRLREAAAGRLARQDAPAWCLVSGPMVDISSTQIRDRGEWVR